MKKIFRLFMLAAAGFALGACTPDAPELPEMTLSAEDLVMGEAYTITQDADDPNTIYLTSLIKGVTPLWEYPGGRSQKSEVKLQIAFKGQYTFKFGVLTPGGYVYAEPYVLDLTTDNFAYVEDELWTCLSGGRGNSKTWVLDIDAEGNTTYFKGPKWFFSNGYTWDALHKADGSCYLDMSDYAAAGYAECIAPYIVDGASAWYWAADWAGNQWMCGAANYGTITFDLIDGANCTVVDANGNETKGSYILDLNTHEIALTDVVLLNPDNLTANPTTLRLIALDEYRMQIAAVPDPPYTAPDDPSMNVYNFVTKEYFDNPPAPEAPKEPELPNGWKDIVGQITQTAIKWTLSTENPIDWCSLAGEQLNGWKSPSDYPAWLGTPDPAVYGDFSLTMDSSTNAYIAVAPDGTETAGNYTLDEKGIYCFDNGLPSFTIVGWASFATTADNELRIMSIGTTASGSVKDMWVGAKDPSKDEYVAYHLIANVGSGSAEEEDPGIITGGTELDVDNSKIRFGHLEKEKSDFRIEIFNEYGSTKNDPPIELSKVDFQTISITFTLSGLSFNEGAAGNYKAGCYYAADGWYPQYDGKSDTTITGDGTYTITFTPEAAAKGAIVFVIDIFGIVPDLADLSAITATVDKIVMK